MTTYDSGSAVRISTVFTDSSGTAVDPTKVFFSFRPDATGIVTTYVYGTDAQVVKDSTGHYHVDLNTGASGGEWHWRFWSVGTYQVADEDVFYVRPNAVTPLHMHLALGFGAVAYYGFNEASGNLADLSGNGLTLTATGFPTYRLLGPLTHQTPNYALGLDGSSQYASRADNALLDLGSNFTLEAWIYPDPAFFGSIEQIVAKGSTAYVFGLTASASPKLYLASGSNTVITGGTTISGNTWQHVVATSNGPGLAALYLNGVSDGGAVSSFTWSDNASDLYVGTSNGSIRFFGGRMARIALYPTSLNATQVAALYASR